MTAEEKLAWPCLSVLDLAQVLGTVSEACRRRGLTRTQFYGYRCRFELQGLEGIKDLPLIHKTYQQMTPLEFTEESVALSLAHQAWDGVRLSAHLKLQIISVSSSTIQSILKRKLLARRQD